MHFFGIPRGKVEEFPSIKKKERKKKKTSNKVINVFSIYKRRQVYSLVASRVHV